MVLIHGQKKPWYLYKKQIRNLMYSAPNLRKQAIGEVYLLTAE